MDYISSLIQYLGVLQDGMDRNDNAESIKKTKEKIESELNIK